MTHFLQNFLLFPSDVLEKFDRPTDSRIIERLIVANFRPTGRETEKFGRKNQLFR